MRLLKIVLLPSLLLAAHAVEAAVNVVATTEDLAALRALPHLTILSPADAHEMSACMHLAFASHGPVYLRMGFVELSRYRWCFGAPA